MNECDLLRLIMLTMGIVIVVGGVFLWILDERCTSLDRYISRLEKDLWRRKLYPDSVGSDDG